MTRIGRPRKGEEHLRRDQLLEHAFSLFAEHGYANLSLEKIARGARVSLRTIYHHFGGKAALFGAVVRQNSDRFVAILPLDESSARPIEETLIEFGTRFLHRITRPECLRLRNQIMAEAQRFPEFAAEFYRNGPERTVTGLARFFAVQQQAGRVANQDSEFLAGQFINTLRGEQFQRIQLGIDAIPSEEQIDRWARRAVRLFLHGCLRPGEEDSQESGLQSGGYNR